MSVSRPESERHFQAGVEMKFVILSALALQFFLFSFARADVVSCVTKDQSVHLKLALNPTNPGSVQILSAEARISLFNKSDTRGRKFVGHGRAPRIREVLHSGAAIEVRARGGVFGKGGVVVLPKAPFFTERRDSFWSTYIQTRDGQNTARADLICRRID
jgi:hypothetical protein